MAKQQKRQHVEDFSTEFEEKVLYINRCSKVTKGGRKFSFSALVVVGDGQGHVGYGFAKANEVSDAIRKGTEAARKNIVTIEMNGKTIPHEVTVQWDGAKIFLKPAPPGTGVIAGSKPRHVLTLAGIEDISAKSLGCNNAANMVKATFEALMQLKNKQQVLSERKGEKHV